MTRVFIWCGNTLVYNIEAKRIDVSLDGVFVKITSVDGDVIEISPYNVVIVHEKEKGDAK